jgi:hypothetical protein
MAGTRGAQLGVLAALWVMAMFPATAFASDALIADLEQRARKDGVESVNAYLSAKPSLMSQFNQSTADCNPQAVDLAVRLSRGKGSKASNLHKEALRIAVGACAEFVLTRLSLKEVPAICASASSWTATQTARELRRRIGEIEADESLRQSPRGKACSAAYLYELQNTRVGIKALPPSHQTR